MLCLQWHFYCFVYRQWYFVPLILQVMIVRCIYRRWYCCVTGSDVFVFTGGDIFLCLQVVIFCCVYKQKYFGVFTGRDILLCLQAVALTDTTKWLSFDAARDYCRGVGGDLVSIHSAGENSFVQNLVGLVYILYQHYHAWDQLVFQLIYSCYFFKKQELILKTFHVIFQWNYEKQWK